jgi:soluble lytic murein transglycosylase
MHSSKNGSRSFTFQFFNTERVSTLVGMLVFACLFFATFTTFSSAAFFSENSHQQELTTEYKTLMTEASRGENGNFIRLSHQYEYHPLLPYAQSEYLSASLDINKKTVINEFIKHYAGAPFVKTLQVKWLNYLAANQYKRAFQQSYKQGISARLDCKALSWHHQDGFPIETLNNDLTELWLTPNSLPNQCDGILKSWQESGLLTQDLIIKRLSLAAKKGNYKLARYLKGLLGNETKYLARQWLQVTKRPSAVYSDRFFVLFNEAELEIIQAVKKKLAFRNPVRFYTWWTEKTKAKFLNNNKATPQLKYQLAQIDRQVAVALAVSEKPIALSLLINLPDSVVDETVKHWRIAGALATQNWPLVLTSLSSLPDHYQVDPSVVYWQANAHFETGNKTYANHLFTELAERRDYYGFLAAERLGKTPQIRHEPIAIEKGHRLAVHHNSAFQRATTLFLIGDSLAARKEWNYLETQLSDERLLVAANLAARKGWVDRPIFALAKLDYLNDVALRFPMAYNDIISNAAIQSELPESLLFAIARRESSFIPDAYSSAGAAGVMQMKPSTASYVANKKITKRDLFKPDLNIKLAGNYLSKLNVLTKQHPVLMAASYNAGFSKVKQWLPKVQMSADLWIESIPYHETRNYVKAIIAYQKVYEALLQSSDKQRLVKNSLAETPNERIKRVNWGGDITNMYVQPEI